MNKRSQDASEDKPLPSIFLASDGNVQITSYSDAEMRGLVSRGSEGTGIAIHGQ